MKSLFIDSNFFHPHIFNAASSLLSAGDGAAAAAAAVVVTFMFAITFGS